MAGSVVAHISGRVVGWSEIGDKVAGGSTKY